jgi:drug/metabolite transporter (DMT)-like permease
MKPAPKLAPTALLALGAVYTIWGSTYLALRWLVAEVPALLAAGSRFVLAGSALLAFALLRKPKAAAAPEDAPSVRPTARGLFFAILAGSLMFLVGNGFVSLAEKEVSSGLAAVVCGTMPLFVSIFGFFLGEAPSWKEGLGLALGFLGVAVVGSGSLNASFGAGTLLLLAQIGWAIGSLVNRRFGKEMGSGLFPSALQMIGGGLVTVVVALAKGERFPTAAPSALAIGAFAYLCVFGSIVAFTAYTHLLRTVTPALATSYAYVTPLVAVVLGWSLGREKIGPATIVGGLLVALGVALVLRGKRPKPA